MLAWITDLKKKQKHDKQERNVKMKFIFNSICFNIFVWAAVSVKSEVTLKPFSPSFQISQSEFHPVNVNDHFNYPTSNRRQFDTSATFESNSPFEKLSNPFEYHQQSTVQQVISQPTVPQTAARLSNPFEFSQSKSNVPQTKPSNNPQSGRTTGQLSK